MQGINSKKEGQGSPHFNSSSRQPQPPKPAASSRAASRSRPIGPETYAARQHLSDRPCSHPSIRVRPSCSRKDVGSAGRRTRHRKKRTIERERAREQGAVAESGVGPASARRPGAVKPEERLPPSFSFRVSRESRRGRLAASC